MVINLTFVQALALLRASSLKEASEPLAQAYQTIRESLFAVSAEFVRVTPIPWVTPLEAEAKKVLQSFEVDFSRVLDRVLAGVSFPVYGGMKLELADALAKCGYMIEEGPEYD